MLHRYVSWLIILVSLTASTAFAGEVPSIDEELVVRDWWVIGPFLSGVREAGPSALAFDRRADDFRTPLLRPSYPSSLVPGGEARWRHYAADENGAVNVDYPDVPEESMDLVTDEWGFAGGLTVGYAYATLHIEGGPKRAMLDLKFASSVSVNGTPWPGDPYGIGYGMTPVLLEDGDNELRIGVSSRQRFSLRFQPVEGDLIAHAQSIIAPTITRGIAPPEYIGIPLANTTNDWLTVDSASIETNGLFGGVSIEPANIPPLCVYYLAVTVHSDLAEVPEELEGEEFEITVNLSYGDGELAVPINMEVRNPEQSRKVTFLSRMDNSVQYYGLLPPSQFDPDREYGLILSLHGAGVEAYPNQINAYLPKDWAYVAAPTNRRRFGFDWQDWGQLDMLEVRKHVMRNHSIDENRVHLTGHSMGGHGTWLNAFTYPELWASAAPSAGWTRFDLYVPMFLRKNLLYGEPRANYIWQLAMRQDDSLALAENALNLPIYALEGGADDNVPPQQPRLIYEQLRRLGYDVTYEEVPGKGHWWNDPDTPGTDCVDSPALNEFWKHHVRDPNPDEIVFRTSNYSITNGVRGLYGIPEDAYRDMVIRAKRTEDLVTITTANVLQLLLYAPRWGIVDEAAGQIKVTVDGIPLSITPRFEGSYIASLRKQDDEWVVNQDFRLSADDPDFPHKKLGGRHAYGPWKGIYTRPVCIVAGTTGTTEENAWNLHLARLYACQWWYRANGSLRVVTDNSDFKSRERQMVHLIGGPESNKLTKSVLSLESCELLNTDGQVVLDGEPVNIPDLSYKFIQIGDRSRTTNLYTGTNLYLIEGGTSLEAMQRLPSMMGIYSGAGMPDWMVWEDEIKLKGLGGVIGMGFFDLDWQIDENLSYFNEELINRLDS